MKYLLVFSFSTLLIISCGSQNFDKQTYTANKQSLADKEKNSPLSFLKVDGDNHKSLFGIGRETVVNGTITNNATVCSYKNIRVKMLCFSDGKRVEEHEDVISETINPASSKDFKTRYKLPKGTDSIALSIMSAEAVLPSSATTDK